MMDKLTGALSAIRKWSRNKVTAVKAASRRYKKAGGFSGSVKRVRAGLKRKRPEAFATVGIAALIVLGLPALIIVLCVSPGAADTGNAAAASVVELATPAPVMASPTPVPTPVPTPTPVPIHLEKGMEEPIVSEIQARLMKLGYMDYDEPTQLYGPNTKYAVELFQRTTGMNIDGVTDQATYDLMMSSDAKKYMVSIGVSGSDVTELQNRLVQLDYMKVTTGYFGTDTETAVKAFQEKNDLTVDGKVGEQTREKLYSEDVVANAISYGEKSDDVMKYQKRLSRLGYLTTDPDGTFGKDTVAAVKLFQQCNGLIADGYIGPETRQLLMSENAQSNAMTYGFSGSTVERVQKRLKELNYLKKVTGYYGSDTEAAVRTFQKRNGLSVDGKVGRQTMNTLFSDSAKKADTSQPSETAAPNTGGSTGGGTVTGVSADALIEVAKTRLGCGYTRGAKGPSEFDCSGFVYWALNNAGIRQGYMTSKTWRTTDKYQRVSSIDNLKKGDVIVFKMSSSSGHVAICMGDGTMIHASSSKDQVMISSYLTNYWRNVFYCAYRIF